MRKVLVVFGSLCIVSALLAFSLLGKDDWNYTANCGGYADKGMLNVEITAFGGDKKTLDEYLKKCAVHAVIFRGLAPSKENKCSLQGPILKDIFAEEEHKKYFKKFFEDQGPYNRFVTVVKENSGTELFYKGQGYKKTMVIGVRIDELEAEIKNIK